MATTGRDPAFEQLLATTQALASQIQQQHNHPHQPRQSAGTHKAPMSSNLAWHLQQPRATSWQSQPGESQVPWQYQQPHPVQPLYQQRPQAAPQAPSGQGFLGFVEQHKQFHGYASTASGNTSSSDDRSAGDASRNDSMESTHSGSWGLLRDVGQFGSLDSEMAYASVEELLADGDPYGFLDESYGKATPHATSQG